MARNFSLKSTDSREDGQDLELSSTMPAGSILPTRDGILSSVGVLKAWMQALSTFFVFFNTW